MYRILYIESCVFDHPRERKSLFASSIPCRTSVISVGKYATSQSFAASNTRTISLIWDLTYLLVPGYAIMVPCTIAMDHRKQLNGIKIFENIGQLGKAEDKCNSINLEVDIYTM